MIRSSTQAPFATRDSLAKLFGLPVERIRIRSAPLGGAFGGKMMIIDPLVASAVLVLGRPVALAMTRSEDMAASNPAGAEILSLELGADAEGNLTGIRSRVLVDRGATDDFGVESIASLLASGPYRWQAHELISLGVATNRVTFGAYRAPTAPPAAFAVESLIDELARRLEMDPLELRLRNVVDEGDPNPAGQPFPIFGARQCLERLRDHPLWAQRAQRLRRRGHRRRDRMVARRLRARGRGLPPRRRRQPDRDHRRRGHERRRDRLRHNRRRGVRRRPVEGSAWSTPTRRALPTPAPAAAARSPTRSAAPSSAPPPRPASACSRSRPTSSRSPPRTSRSSTARCSPPGCPRRRSRSTSSRRRSSASAARTRRSRATDASPCRRPPSRPPTSRTSASTRTPARSRVLGHVVAQDVGRALNPALVEGQMRGGTTQGLGWALLEELVHDSHGQLTTGTFVDYACRRPSTPADRYRDRRGPGARGALRRQGRRRGAGRRRARCGRQRDRRRDRRRPGLAAADDARARLACDVGRQREALTQRQTAV